MKFFQKAEKKLVKLPTSPATDLIYRTMGVNGDTSQLEQQSKATRTPIEYTLKEQGKARLVEAKRGNTLTTIEITDIEKLMGNRRGVKKIFLYSLVAINEQAFSVDHKTGARVLRQDFVSFSLADMKEAGLYSDPKSCRRGFMDAGSALTSLKVKGKVVECKGKRKTTLVDRLEVMFTGYKIEKGICTLYLNERIDWSFLARFYTVLPRYAFGLKTTDAFDLMYLIFFLARQNVESIKEKGYFNISMATVHARLGLPSVEDTRKLSEKIKYPIDNAITAIEDLHRTIYRDADFTITPVYNEKWGVAEYLEKGYLKIAFTKDFAQYFIDIATDKAQQIEQANKKKEARIEKAKTQALTNAIAEELKNSPAMQDVKEAVAVLDAQKPIEE